MLQVLELSAPLQVSLKRKTACFSSEQLCLCRLSGLRTVTHDPFAGDTIYQSEIFESKIFPIIHCHLWTYQILQIFWLKSMPVFFSVLANIECVIRGGE